jgi:drug/metabolite transporter (DMT)-like permease
MATILRRLRGALGIGLTWAVLWATFGLTMGFLILYFDPASIDQGEDPVTLAGLLGTVGFTCGAIFAAVMSFAERRTPLRDLPLWRAALWGALGGVALPLLTTMNDQVIFNTAPLGALSALFAVALARRAERQVTPAPETELV